MSAHKSILLESGGAFYVGFAGDILDFTEADRQLLSTVTDAMKEHEIGFSQKQSEPVSNHG